MATALAEFLQGFGSSYLFSCRPRPGAPTQVFATEEVPCDPAVQGMVDSFIVSRGQLL